MKIIKNIKNRFIKTEELDIPLSVKDIKLCLLDKEYDFQHSEIKSLFNIPETYYPNFQKWYNNKVRSEALFANQNELFVKNIHSCINKNDEFKYEGRLVLAMLVNEHYAGISVLKKTINENKISTFFIEEKFHKIGIARLLLNYSLRLLNDKPIEITVSEESLDKLFPFLCKNGFYLSDEINGEYRKNKKEMHFKK